MIKGIDLFAGAGGTSTGALMAGVDIIWAANHNPVAVEYHAKNHPQISHVCQDLQQADWSQVPEHDILYASPCCQGHSRAAGKVKTTLKADLSRSTAWAVISCLEAHKTPVAIIENVEDFLRWSLYEPWVLALKKLGYSLSVNLINLSSLGAPQNRKRLILIATRSKAHFKLNIPKVRDLVPARSIIDLREELYVWDKVSSRVKATQYRVKNGRKDFGGIFLDAAYGSARTGRSLDKPLGTVMTTNKHSLVVGDMIRPISIREQAAAQTFPDDYIWPVSKTLTKLMIGNAVPPLMAKEVSKAVLRAA